MWPEGTIWQPNDRIVAPHDDPAVEWLADLSERESAQLDERWAWRVAKSYDPNEIF